MIHRACRSIFLVICVLLASTGCQKVTDPEVAIDAVGADAARPSSLGEEVQSLLEELEIGGAEVVSSPGAAVMVIRDGEVVYAGGRGLADLASKEPLASTTPFRLASVSKAFTAMAIVLLAEDGSLSFDDPAARWVPELSRFEDVTVRHLLHHTSGLPSYYGDKMEELREVAASKEGELFTSADAIALYRDWGEPVFEPGERFEYSNPGYEILGLIVQRISGKSFGDFLEERIFAPLEMTSAVVRDSPETVIPDRAVGYRQLDSGKWIEQDDHWANWVVGSGGVYASLDDLYRWDQALSTGELVSAESYDEIFAPAVLTDGSESLYGFGWGLEEIEGRPAIHHLGAWVGFRTGIARFVEDDLTVIVLANTPLHVADLRDEIAELALAEP